MGHEKGEKTSVALKAEKNPEGGNDAVKRNTQDERQLGISKRPMIRVKEKRNNNVITSHKLEISLPNFGATRFVKPETSRHNEIKKNNVVSVCSF